MLLIAIYEKRTVNCIDMTIYFSYYINKYTSRFMEGL